jgi:hypothetical protein
MNFSDLARQLKVSTAMLEHVWMLSAKRCERRGLRSRRSTSNSAISAKSPGALLPNCFSAVCGGEEKDANTVVFKPELILRGSTTAPKRG